jgi:cytochrome c-type biogenesis protein CcmH
MPPMPPAPAEPAVASAPVATTGSASAAAAGTLEIDVQIDPTLAASARPGDVLYVFARSTNGGGPPFAAKRIELGKLPMHLQLSDADSPMPAARLSSQQTVMLMARLSRSGDVKAASGDIEADPQQVSVGSGKPVTLVLNRPVP